MHTGMHKTSSLLYKIILFLNNKIKTIKIRKSKFQVHAFKCLRIFIWNLVALQGTIFSQKSSITQRHTDAFVYHMHRLHNHDTYYPLKLIQRPKIIQLSYLNNKYVILIFIQKEVLQLPQHSIFYFNF